MIAREQYYSITGMRFLIMIIGIVAVAAIVSGITLMSTGYNQFAGRILAYSGCILGVAAGSCYTCTKGMYNIVESSDDEEMYV